MLVRALTVSVAALTLATPGLADVATGDCDGWTMTSTAAPDVGSYYSVAVGTLFRLEGADWVVVEVQMDQGLLAETFTDWSDPNQPPSVMYLGSSWSEELAAGTYRVEVEMTSWASGVNGAWQSLADVATNQETIHKVQFREVPPFECSGPPPPPSFDPRTPGYWKNHPEAWPLLDLPLGDQQSLFSQSCLLDAFDLPTRGDVRVILLHHLVAAKLNILSGSDPLAVTGFPTAGSTVVDTILAADDFLRSSEIGCGGLGGSKPSGADREYAVDLKDALDAFNNDFE